MSPDKRRRERGRSVGESILPLGEKTVFVSSGGVWVGVWWGGVWWGEDRQSYWGRGDLGLEGGFTTKGLWYQKF